MKKQAYLPQQKLAISFLSFFLFFIAFQQVNASTIETDTIGSFKYKGKIVESKSKKPLVFASITVNGTNISTVSNSRGEFLLKVPKKHYNKSATFSFLGYTSKVINLEDLDRKDNVIQLETYIEELSEVQITVKDAETLMKEVLNKKKDNYFSDYTSMTSFYRETIKKRRTYVSLSEAIVLISKQPYTSNRNDILQLLKSRKSTDYRKLDTIVLKQRGGPYNTIHLDVMKNPELLLTEEMFTNYTFSFGKSTKIDNRVVYVVKFKQKEHVQDALFHGKLFIDAESLAMTSAEFDLNLSDREKASRFFILRKPRKAKVLPIQAKYYVNYREQGGKWYHSYSRIELGFKIDWDKKLFNSVYYTTMELAITDWKKSETTKNPKYRDRLRTSVVMTDEASGFSDPEFWGEYNVIEPEKPIDNAIKKIRRQLSKLSK